MAEARRPSPALLRKLFRYEPLTGVLYWLPRLDAHPGWNTKYAGREAFSVDASTGYRSGSACGFNLLAHRVAWAMQTGEWPSGEIDHINGNRSDNRWANLRAVPKAENAKNQRLRATNASGAMGVMWIAERGKWRARIMVGGRNQSLGCFDTFNEACEARKAAEARLGFHENHGKAA